MYADMGRFCSSDVHIDYTAGRKPEFVFSWVAVTRGGTRVMHSCLRLYVCRRIGYTMSVHAGRLNIYDHSCITCDTQPVGFGCGGAFVIAVIQ